MLPKGFLDDMTKDCSRKPIFKAAIAGPRQDADVNVIYQFEPDSTDACKWRAMGFEGEKWTAFVMMNLVEKKFKMMFTNLRDRTYTMHVFNQKGVGLGVKNIRKFQVIENNTYSFHLCK
jgi:hypothetical protein